MIGVLDIVLGGHSYQAPCKSLLTGCSCELDVICLIHPAVSWSGCYQVLTKDNLLSLSLTHKELHIQVSFSLIPGWAIHHQPPNLHHCLCQQCSSQNGRTNLPPNSQWSEALFKHFLISHNLRKIGQGSIWILSSWPLVIWLMYDIHIAYMCYVLRWLSWAKVVCEYVLRSQFCISLYIHTSSNWSRLFTARELILCQFRKPQCKASLCWMADDL